MKTEILTPSASTLQDNLQFMRDDEYHLRSHLNYNYDSTYSPQLDGVSLTIPDMTLSLQDIIARFTRGLAVPQLATYHADEDLSFIDKLSEFERIDLHRQLVERGKVLRDTFYKSRQDAIDAQVAIDKQNSIDAAVKAALQDKEDKV
jgi:hypothetical protein